MYIDRADSYGGSRTGVKFHPATDTELRRGVGWDNNSNASNSRFNRNVSGRDGHIIALTWDDNATDPMDKLKVSWAMEHEDSSNNTGITLFDFDNNNAADLCYRDERTLRVISPAKSGRDYVPLGETVSSTSSVMFSRAVYCGTAFEYPVIADVNMDGSADIVVTNIGSYSLDRSRGYFEVFEYSGQKWAPCPPVWNQGMYDPLQVREDLKINARPASMLTEFEKNGETVTPYNGSWMQHPIVRDGDDYVPVVRKPDVDLLDMVVQRLSSTQTRVTLDIRNNGSASVNAQTPVAFYNGGLSGNAIGGGATLIGAVRPVGVDIFPGERVALSFLLTGADYNNCLIWARIMDDGAKFPADGYADCDLSNNTLSGSDCPLLSYGISVSPDSILCDEGDFAVLKAEVTGTATGTRQYTWYRNNVEIPGETGETYAAPLAGEYKCFVRDGLVCRGFTPVQVVNREYPTATDDRFTVTRGLQTKLNVLLNDNRTAYCNPLPDIEDGPHHGTAYTDADGYILYTPDAIGPVPGYDTLVYRIDNSYATVYFTLTNMPDNISDPDCWLPAPPTTWGIANTWSSEGSSVSNLIIPLVGDLDDDGIPEIVCFGTAGEINSDPRTAKTVLIYDGKTHALKQTISLPYYISAFDAAGYGLVKIPEGRKGLIVVADGSLHLRAFDITGEEVWVSDQPFGTVNKDIALNVGFADFNNDGYPEVYVRDKIFNASTGKLLATATGGTNTGSAWAHFSHIVSAHKLSSPIAANVVGDDRLELILGNEIYNVNIIDTVDVSQNSVTLYKHQAPPSGVVEDGHAQVADFNNDGHPDILISNRSTNAYTTSSSVAVYIWDIYNDRLMGAPLIIPTNMSGKSIPLIADVNSNGKLDIVIQCDATDAFNVPSFGNITAAHDIRAYEYDYSGQEIFSCLWGYDPDEDSYSNGATLFDFNLDGVNEVLISDQSRMRILNGADGVERALQVFSEVTIMQYPVIADVDDDGSAEIVAVGSNKLNIFKSSGAPWAPARPVWNQYMYHSVNVNKDLTVPPVQYNPATELSGKHPFNNFLQQQTVLFADGTPVMLMPDVFIAGAPVTHHDAVGDSMTVTLQVRNTGDAALQSPLRVAAYRNTVSPGTCIGADSIPVAVDPGVAATVSITFTLHNISGLLPADTVRFRVNDRGGATYILAECDTFNNVLPHPCDSLLLARNDYAGAVSEIDALIDILANDSVTGSCKPVPGMALVAPFAQHGTASFDGGKLKYTSFDGFFGRDSIDYTITCGSNTSTARVYVTVAEKPDNIIEAACWTLPPGETWKGIQLLKESSANYFAYGSPVLAGDLDRDGHVEIVLNDGSPDYGTKLVILDDNLNVKYTLTSSEQFVNTTATFSMANVDGGPNAAIFIATRNRNLKKFVLNTTNKTYVESWSVSYSSNTNYDMGNPLITDFNGDGFAEISVYDKIFDAQTGTLLANGDYLGAGAPTANNNKFGMTGGHPIGGSKHASLMAAGDIDGDLLPELIGGNCVYKVIINSRTDSSQNSFTLLRRASATGHSEVGDGPTSLADMDLDGHLDVIVTRNISTSYHGLYIWNPRTGEVMHSDVINNLYVSNHGNFGPSIAAIGNLDADPIPEIAFIGFDYMYVYDYDPSGKRLTQKWRRYVNDESAITLFDFNQDNKYELVYRDFTNLMVIDGETQSVLTDIACGSGTANEYPLILDVNGDGHAEFVIVAGGNNATYGTVRIYGLDTWAPARRVWNQYAYNAVNVNDNLTIPRYQVNPATVFPGVDNILGTADDIRPYNNFLQQQTTLSANGVPIWFTPDAVADPTISGPSLVVGNYIYVTVGIINNGDAVLGPHVHVTLYDQDVDTANIINTVDSVYMQINKGDTGYVTIPVDMDLYPAVVNVIAKVNDSGTTYIYQPECDSLNNEISMVLFRPMLSNDMKKEAKLLPSTVADNGTYSNPVSILYGDTLEYKITAVNANLSSGSTLIIRDTIPAYLRYVAGTAASPSPYLSSIGDNGTISGPPERDTIVWTFTGMPSLETVEATFRATPASGVSASQPMFVNRAWVTVSDSLDVSTNSTHHQGAGVSIVTFSASAGGEIYNATPQALDFRTSPRNGVLVVPDAGYRFAGWSHDGYTSLRGERVEARDGIMLYDTLVIYGNVELRAGFVPEEYPVRYYLNGGENASGNPAAYTVESGAIALEAPRKTGDVFTGWTGSNGDDPQAEVVIPRGSTGERDYYANYLYGGREKIEGQALVLEDRIWASGDELYVRTAKAGSIVRVYSPDGLLHKLQTIVAAGETRMKLQRGIYIVTLNNSVGRKVIIEK
jgi:uncharacterized repeat protein (TIGR02543 family)